MQRGLLILLIGLLARDAMASPWFRDRPHSLELMTLAYPHVLLCRVEEVFEFDRATLQLVAVLKGPTPESTRFHRRLWSPTKVGDLVVMFDEDPRADVDGQVIGAIINPRTSETLILSFELRPLTNMDEIVGVVRDAVTFRPEAASKITVCRPSDYAHVLPQDWDAFPNFPVDARLERHARQWVRSPKLPVRLAGAHALSWFKSDENVRILQGLLDDPGTLPGSSQQHYLVSTAPEYFPVRIMALSVLRKWGGRHPSRKSNAPAHSGGQSANSPCSP